MICVTVMLYRFWKETHAMIERYKNGRSRRSSSADTVGGTITNGNFGYISSRKVFSKELASDKVTSKAPGSGTESWAL